MPAILNTLNNYLKKQKIDYEKAYEMALLCDLSYRMNQNKIAVNSILKELKKRDDSYYFVKPFNKKSTQAILVGHEKYNALIFPGTAQIADWLDNGKINKIPKFGGKIHEGFHNAFVDILEDFLTCWNDLEQETKSKPLYGGGHSLGGALLANAICSLAESGINFKSCYGYGAPRIGNKNFANTFNQKYSDIFINFQNDSDLVPLVPSTLLGYVDCGATAYFNSKGNLNFYKDISWKKQLCQFLKASFHDIISFNPNWVGDHHIESYKIRINSLRRG